MGQCRCYFYGDRHFENVGEASPVKSLRIDECNIPTYFNAICTPDSSLLLILWVRLNEISVQCTQALSPNLSVVLTRQPAELPAPSKLRQRKKYNNIHRGFLISERPVTAEGVNSTLLPTPEIPDSRQSMFISFLLSTNYTLTPPLTSFTQKLIVKIFESSFWKKGALFKKKSILTCFSDMEADSSAPLNVTTKVKFVIDFWQIAVIGCTHGQLDSIYAKIASIELQRDIKVDLVLCCGDFEVCRRSSF